MLVEDNVKRDEWRLGRIEELVVGKDCVVRGAKVKTSTNKRVTGKIHGPLQKLHQLEVGDVSMNDTDGPSSVPMALDNLTSQLTPDSKHLSPKLLDNLSLSSTSSDT